MTGFVGFLAAAAAFATRRSARARWRRLMREQQQRVALGPLPRVPWSAAVVAIVVAVGVGGAVAGGPVAGAVSVAYAALGAVMWRRARRRRSEDRAHRAAVDGVAALAAELRAGQPVESALGTSHAAAGEGVGGPSTVVRARVAAAVQVAESSGAPLADVLERLDTHLRAVDRARAIASAQAAGARASAALLAAMPVAGAGLGAAVGVDSSTVLLHTPLGAACLAGALVLQLAGLAWASRLSRVEVPA